MHFDVQNTFKNDFRRSKPFQDNFSAKNHVSNHISKKKSEFGENLRARIILFAQKNFSALF